MMLAGGGLVAAVLAYGPQRLAVAMLDTGDRLGIGFVLRFDMWSRALAMIGDMPLTGVGLNGYSLILSHFYPGYLLGPEPHAHNLLLQTAVDLGVPGLLALLWLIVTFFVVVAAASRHGEVAWQRALLLGLAGALLAYVAGGILDVVTLGAKPLVTLWLLLGVGAAAARLLPWEAGGARPAGRGWLLPVTGVLLLALAVLGLALAPGVLAGNAGSVRGHRALVAAREAGRLPAAEAEAAVVWLEQALGQRPDDPDLHRLLGSLYAWQGDYAAAVEQLQWRVELDGPQALDTYAPFVRWQRQLAGEPAPPAWESTARLYTHWMNRYPRRAEETLLLVMVRQRQGEHAAAEQLLDAAIERGAEPVGLLQWYREGP